MADKLIQLGAGDYTVRDVVADTTSTVTVPVLTAGSIVQATPTVGDTLTVTGSNATAKATFQWQDSTDGTTGWADIVGATAATLDTTALPAKFYRRGVTGLTQGPVYTAAVEVAAAAPTDLLTYTGAAVQGSHAAGIVTSPALAIGAEHENRRVYGLMMVNLSSNVNPTSVTIGGVTAALEGNLGIYNQAKAFVYSAIVPIGTTAVMAADFVASGATLGDSVFAAICGNNVLTHAVGTSFANGVSSSGTVNVESGGSVFAFTAANNLATELSHTPAGMNLLFDFNTSFRSAGASMEQGLSVETGRVVGTSLSATAQHNSIYVSVKAAA